MTDQAVVFPTGFDLDTSTAPASGSSFVPVSESATNVAVDKKPVPAAAMPASTNPHAMEAPMTANLDHFIKRDGELFAGSHLIIDLWQASRLDDLEHVRATLIKAAAAAKATVLHVHLHHFTENGGISGVAVLAESHISIHSWPEVDYAALDVFMCGDSMPMNAIPVLEEAFRPGRVDVRDLMRGRMAHDSDEASSVRTVRAA